jgi:outer membrane protein assembly factor BamB
MPVMASPTLSSDGQFLFVPSTTTTFYCIHAPTGAEVWKLKHRKRSIYMNEAKLSPDDAMVYSILVCVKGLT